MSRESALADLRAAREEFCIADRYAASTGVGTLSYPGSMLARRAGHSRWIAYQHWLAAVRQFREFSEENGKEVWPQTEPKN